MRDSGILHTLLGIKESMAMFAHPKVGFSWEGFVIEQLIRLIPSDQPPYFYKTHGGTELDLLLHLGTKRYGFEFKMNDQPTLTKSMHMVLDDLELEKLFIVYPGKNHFRLHPKIETLPVTDWAGVLQNEGLITATFI